MRGSGCAGKGRVNSGQEVEIRGRVASLLEVGTGFHGELTGRENIYLNGAILGMRRAVIDRKFDEIVAFAEVEKFLDTPVKRYSSGMYVRLAFAVAAHLETDVLIVDEILSVGDASFQRKSLGKMNEVARTGRTVLFVSHHLSAVRNLCSRVLLFETGRLEFIGSVEDGLSVYERTHQRNDGMIASTQFHGSLSENIRFEKILFKQGGITVNVLNPILELQIEVCGFSLKEFPEFELKIGIFRDGFHITSCYDTPFMAPLNAGQFIISFSIPSSVFKPGIYTIGVGAIISTGSWLWGSDVGIMDFSENYSGSSSDRNRGVVAIPYVAKRVQ